ncbi:hypothetical protein EPUS_02463 [Endocarpon pusillum Z07020]|uniref:DUF1279 domain-containing protein n=1 Tax=Endocarpon pusillum (strain Z07020 / HMAS-L-300199) TaxID=1263415 RepID=U1G070_ENDPU|nr:uncharacterized protein EPUS_02463 [Endocarpon pusillum Z07020]ERF70597.1 hypothetical protein EPUS_02463 [Endocarpon pusillum Z07020]
MTAARRQAVAEPTPNFPRPAPIAHRPSPIAHRPSTFCLQLRHLPSQLVLLSPVPLGRSGRGTNRTVDMESMRLLQQRALRQIFQFRPLRTARAVRHISSNRSANQQQCLCRSQNNSSRLPSINRHYPRTPFSSPRFTKPTRRFYSSQTSGASPSSSEETLTLSQRMRKLSREYGYAALGVYLALTALDLPFCYLAVSYLGTERIGRWEHAIMSYVKSIVKWPMGKEGQEKVDEGAEYVRRKVPLEEEVVEGRETTGKRLLEEEDTTPVVDDHGIGEAEKANRGDNASMSSFSLSSSRGFQSSRKNPLCRGISSEADLNIFVSAAGFWTKLALAYAIHKSFIFIRVPLTAAITPKVVKTLRSWGWKIGKMPTKKSVAGTTGINTGRTGVKPDK